MAEEEPKDTARNEDMAAASEPIPSEVQKIIDEKDRKLVELTDDLKRLQAEFENFKKRNEKEWSERVAFANQRIIADLLMVLDSFDKALEDALKAGDNGCLKQGVERVQKQFMQILAREGLREIDTKDKFDPFFHEAVVREEKDDAEDGKILEVYQKGYTLGRKALRPAKVKVAKKAEKQGPPAETVGEVKNGMEETDDEQHEVK